MSALSFSRDVLTCSRVALFFSKAFSQTLLRAKGAIGPDTSLHGLCVSLFQQWHRSLGSTLEQLFRRLRYFVLWCLQAPSTFSIARFWAPSTRRWALDSRLRKRRAFHLEFA